MKIFRFLVLGILLSSFSSIAGAGMVLVDLTGNGGDFDFESPSGTVTIADGGILDGLTITVTAFVEGFELADFSGQEGVNGADGGLGVNAPGTGDETSQLDGDNGLESLLFEFSNLSTLSNLALDSLLVDVGDFAGADAGNISFNSSPSVSLVDGSVSLASSPNLLGSSFAVNFTANQSNALGTGFALESFTLSATAVPELSTLTLVGIAGVGGMFRRRRRRVA